MLLLTVDTEYLIAKIGIRSESYDRSDRSPHAHLSAKLEELQKLEEREVTRPEDAFQARICIATGNAWLRKHEKVLQIVGPHLDSDFTNLESKHGIFQSWTRVCLSKAAFVGGK